MILECSTNERLRQQQSRDSAMPANCPMAAQASRGRVCSNKCVLSIEAVAVSGRARRTRACARLGINRSRMALRYSTGQASRESSDVTSTSLISQVRRMNTSSETDAIACPASCSISADAVNPKTGSSIRLRRANLTAREIVTTNMQKMSVMLEMLN